MKSWVKWILVLPAAIGAYVGVQIVVAVSGEITGLWTLLTQFIGALVCPIAFVEAGAITAPAYRHITSICLTIVLAIYSTAVVTCMSWNVDSARCSSVVPSGVS